jgi:signal peptidase I
VKGSVSLGSGLTDAGERERRKMRRQSLLLTTLVATFVAGLITPLHTTVVWGESMAPTLRPGGLYVLDTRYYRDHPVERHDIVVFRYRGETCTKRVYALPGERLVLLRYPDGHGTEVLDPSEADAMRSLQRSGRLAGRWLSELTVPPGHYYVVGDNRDVSWDSRSFGCLPKAVIMGRLSL